MEGWFFSWNDLSLHMTYSRECTLFKILFRLEWYAFLRLTGKFNSQWWEKSLFPASYQVEVGKERETHYYFSPNGTSWFWYMFSALFSCDPNWRPLKEASSHFSASLSLLFLHRLGRGPSLISAIYQLFCMCYALVDSEHVVLIQLNTLSRYTLIWPTRKEELKS